MIGAAVIGPDGEVVRGDVCLVTRDCAVTAIRSLDEHGRAWFEAHAAHWLLVRCIDPVIAAKAVPLPAGDVDLEIAIAASEVVELSGAIEPPADAAFDWVDLHVTPRSLEWVPASIHRALLAVDTGPALRAAYWTRRLTEPRFRLRVARGRHGLRVNRFLDAPLGAASPSDNLVTEYVTATPPLDAHERFGEVQLELTTDTRVVVTLRSAALAEQT